MAAKKISTNPQTKTTARTATPTAGTVAPTAETSTTAVPDAGGEVKIEVSGKMKASMVATAGQTLRRAFLESKPDAAKEREHERYSFMDANSRPVSLDRVLKPGELKLTAIARTSGG